MPTVLRAGAYRFFFYSALRMPASPPYHVGRDDNVAKFWLDPLRLVASGRFPRPELRYIERLVAENMETLLEAWRGFFGR